MARRLVEVKPGGLVFSNTDMLLGLIVRIYTVLDETIYLALS